MTRHCDESRELGDFFYKNTKIPREIMERVIDCDNANIMKEEDGGNRQEQPGHLKKNFIKYITRNNK